MKIEIEGAKRLASTIDTAAKELTNLAATNRAVANAVLAAAHPPVLTGRLLASLEASGTDKEAIVSSDVIYAPIIERSRGFLAAALSSTEGTAINLHLRHIDGALGKVKGV